MAYLPHVASKRCSSWRARLVYYKKSRLDIGRPVWPARAQSAFFRNQNCQRLAYKLERPKSPGAKPEMFSIVFGLLPCPSKDSRSRYVRNLLRCRISVRPISGLGHVWMARLGKNFLTFLQHWSGAVRRPASLYGGEKRLLRWGPPLSHDLFVPPRLGGLSSAQFAPQISSRLRRCRRGQERCEHDSPGKFRHG